MVPFPADPVEGNDDSLSDPDDERDNPYISSTNGISLGHTFGQISSNDGPDFVRRNNQGSANGEIYRREESFGNLLVSNFGMEVAKMGSFGFEFRIPFLGIITSV